MQYRNANLCIYKQLDSSWAHFEMNDGFPQSNAVSALLSCLTLLAIINTLHRDLTNQAESHTTLALCTRLNPPSAPPIGAYIDDLSCLVPPEDSLFAFDWFDELGASQGIYLNLSKSMILSMLDPTKPMHHTVLEQALSKLKPSNHLQNGVVYHGTHIGNLNYIQTALTNAAKSFDIR
jgi:hypothetical protein